MFKNIRRCLLDVWWHLLGEGEGWEGHYDYCAVFEYDDFIGLKGSGKPCSEECFNHCGEKILIGKYSKRVRWL